MIETTHPRVTEESENARFSISLNRLRYLRHVWVFQSRPGQGQHTHGCPSTYEDEQGDQLWRKGIN